MTKNPSQPEPERMIALLTKQRDLYQSLRELSEKQRSMISGDRPEKLLNILRDRQGLVTSLARLNEEMGPYRRRWDEVYDTLPESYRTQASDLLHEINGLLRVILQTDQEDSQLLSARKQSVAAAIAGLAGGHAANAAYARQAGATKTSKPAADVAG